MHNKVFSLKNIIKLSDNESLSEQYIRYTCGLLSEKQYRHQEIIDISKLIVAMDLTDSMAEGFIYGYSIPQLNKEFDLLKITSDICLDIEIKSQEVAQEKIARQLLQNHHYLKLLNKPKLLLYTFISATGQLFKLDENKALVECPASELRKSIVEADTKIDSVDLDQVFTPNHILVSPLNATERFLQRDYLLTEHQEQIKRDILAYVNGNATDRFVGLTGGPGTGKTLLIYDIAFTMADIQKVLIVHSGLLCEGHVVLDNARDSLKIMAAKELRLREIRDVDIVIVDEAHRLYSETLEKIQRWVKRAKTTCLFSYDAGQMLSKSEKNRNTAVFIDRLCGEHIFKLTNKIRTNKELALFITCLRDLSKYRSEYSFPHVILVFEPDPRKAMDLVKEFKKRGFTYVSYTPSSVYASLDYQSDTYNTHNVIGQEFDNVCMIMDDYFYYSDDGKLVGRMHPNPDYLFEQLLYQGLTRVRCKIALIVVSENILGKIMPLFQNC